MFIKKDLRKIEEILIDEEDDRTSLKLSKRPAEFKGQISILCRESKIDALKNLRFLNLYENSLTSLQGVGILSQTPLEEINLGCNKLTTIPLEVWTEKRIMYL
jgi:Leucine-rich repeat (LRR) protein